MNDAPPCPLKYRARGFLFHKEAEKIANSFLFLEIQFTTDICIQPVRPLKFAVKDGMLKIMWSDSVNSAISLRDLRRLCPCAHCITEREQRGSNYFPIFNPDQITAVRIEPVGAYAIGIHWRDAHNTGIFDFSYLRSLSLSKPAQ